MEWKVLATLESGGIEAAAAPVTAVKLHRVQAAHHEHESEEPLKGTSQENEVIIVE